LQGFFGLLTQNPLYAAQLIIFSALIIIFMLSIIIGFLKNRQLKTLYAEALSEPLEKYVKKSEYEDAGGSGFKIVTEPKEYLSDLTILLALLNRENLLYPVINRFRPDHDKLAFSGTLKKKTGIILEIIPREERYIKDSFKEIVDLEPVKIDKKFDATFLVKSSDVYSARALFLTKEGQVLREALLKQKDNIRRFAIHKEETDSTLNAIFFIKDKNLEKFFPLVFRMAEVYDSVDFEKYRRSYKTRRAPKE
jgi:hypothetical protein